MHLIPHTLKLVWLPILRSVWVAGVLLTGAGCANRGDAVTRRQSASMERGRELVQAGMEANRTASDNIHRAAAVLEPLKSVQSKDKIETITNAVASAAFSVARADRASDLSADFLGRALTLYGLPAENQKQTVESLLSDNEVLRRKAEASERTRLEEEVKWTGEVRKLEAKLVEYGVKYEEERRKTLIRRFWAWSVGTFGLAGGIAFIVLCPAIALPLLGRLLGIIVEFAPSLYSFVGVVSRKAFDSVVTGISKAKSKLGEKEVETLETQLSKKMDESHKALVRVSKSRNPVDEKI